MQLNEFSFLLPVKNGGNYIKTCIQSILSQTYKNFNLIILENCSTDGTSEWLKGLSDKRVIIYESSKPLSIEENWSRILATQRNEFMVLTGHDDVFEPDYLEIIVSLINKHPNASIYTTHFTLIDAGGNLIRQCKPMDEFQYGYEFLASQLANQADLMGTGFTMRSSDYNMVGGIPVSYPNLLFADLILFFELSTINYKATSLKNCFSFRIHQSTTTSSADSKFQAAFEKVIFYFVDVKKISNTLTEVVERYGQEFVRFYCKGLAHRMMRNPKNNNDKISVKQFVGNCNKYAKLLSPDRPFDAGSITSIKLAKMIDSNAISRSLFLLFKKIYKKPVL